MLISMATGVAAMLNLAGGPWLVINDDVMGGMSTSEMLWTRQGLRFQGRLSLDNNGGFSSARRLLTDAPAGADRVRLEVRGDGRDYQLRLRLDQRLDGVTWSAGFKTTDEWQALEIPLDAFEPVYRGNRVPSAGPAVAGRISQVGVLIADRREGNFRLDIRRLEFIDADG